MIDPRTEEIRANLAPYMADANASTRSLKPEADLVYLLGRIRVMEDACVADTMPPPADQSWIKMETRSDGPSSAMIFGLPILVVCILLFVLVVL